MISRKQNGKTEQKKLHYLNRKMTNFKTNRRKHRSRVFGYEFELINLIKNTQTTTDSTHKMKRFVNFPNGKPTKKHTTVKNDRFVDKERLSLPSLNFHRTPIDTIHSTECTRDGSNHKTTKPQSPIRPPTIEQTVPRSRSPKTQNKFQTRTQCRLTQLKSDNDNDRPFSK